MMAASHSDNWQSLLPIVAAFEVKAMLILIKMATYYFDVLALTMIHS
jgi:hypothetical protein